MVKRHGLPVSERVKGYVFQTWFLKLICKSCPLFFVDASDSTEVVSAYILYMISKIGWIVDRL